MNKAKNKKEEQGSKEKGQVISKKKKTGEKK